MEYTLHLVHNQQRIHVDVNYLGAVGVAQFQAALEGVILGLIISCDTEVLTAGAQQSIVHIEDDEATRGLSRVTA